MNLPATWVIAFQQALIGATTRAAKPTRFEPDLSHYWCTLWLQSCGFCRSCCNIEESLEHTHSPTHFSIIFPTCLLTKMWTSMSLSLTWKTATLTALEDVSKANSVTCQQTNDDCVSQYSNTLTLYMSCGGLSENR